MTAAVESTPPQLPLHPEAHSAEFKKSLSTPLSVDRPFNVYVKNFTADIDNAKLHSMFEAYGTIKSCAVLYDHLGRSKLVGFVQFSSDEEAKKAVQEMHSKDGYGSKPLHVALTNKKPVNTRRRSALSYHAYDYTPLRQPMYGSYPMSSPNTPPTPSQTPGGTTPHMYTPPTPTWGSAGGVQVVLVPYNPYNYSKHAARAGPYPSAPRGAPQKPISPLNPAGLYTGPTYNDQYLQGHYMIPASPPYEQYNGYSHHPYAGYNAGWGTPYYHPYANHPSAHNMNYGYA